ncbi:MAG: hypothetical protein ACC609_00800 [Methanobacterium formicicum]
MKLAIGGDNLDIWALILVLGALAILPIMYGVRYVFVEKKQYSN